MSDLKPGKKVMGKTVAELGNQNNPLDMIVYQKKGEDFLLIANSSRGVMKVSTKNLQQARAIEARLTASPNEHTSVNIANSADALNVRDF